MTSMGLQLTFTYLFIL